jgi:signal transduction histidine kinase
MREATALLEDRNRELDAFAGRVAHDLRGPLTAINLAASDKWESANVVTSAVFRRGVRQMESIIQDLLTLSRISAQVADATCETVNVSAFAEEDLRPNVDAAGGVLDLDVAPATVSCSEGLLRQVLWNLGENAVKYHRREVPLRIEIEGRVVSHDYQFVVSDNGKGMTPLEVRRAFEPFFRGEAEQDTPGTGLGLSIVKRVVEANHGSVACESVSGEGTTFKVRLPLAPKKAA